MEKLEVLPKNGRYHPKGNYDRRFIMEVIKEVEGGLSMSAACSKYNLFYGTVNKWLREPRFRQAKPQRKILSIQDKRSMVRTVIRKGLSFREASVSFGVSIKALKGWTNEFAAENAELSPPNQEELSKKKTEQQSIPDNAQVHVLQQQLEEAQLKIAALNTLIDVAEQQLKIDIRKKPGARQS